PPPTLLSFPTRRSSDLLTKILFEPKTERVLGVGIVGSGAGEMIAEGVIAVETAAVARDLAESIHAHPTLSETIMEAAEGAFGQPDRKSTRLNSSHVKIS